MCTTRRKMQKCTCAVVASKSTVLCMSRTLYNAKRVFWCNVSWIVTWLSQGQYATCTNAVSAIGLCTLVHLSRSLRRLTYIVCACHWCIWHTSKHTLQCVITLVQYYCCACYCTFCVTRHIIRLHHKLKCMYVFYIFCLQSNYCVNLNSYNTFYSFIVAG